MKLPYSTRRVRCLLAIALLTAVAASTRGAGTTARATIQPPASSRAPTPATASQPGRGAAIARAPFDASSSRWIENLGQWPGESRFVAHAGSVIARVTPSALEFQLCSTPEIGTLVRFAFVAPSPAARLEPIGLLPGVHSYFIGRDPDQWHTGARAWTGVVYRDLWPGVDLALGIQNGVLKYDVVVAPHAPLDAVRFAVEGHVLLGLDDGGLVASTETGRVLQPKPASFELSAAESRRAVDVEYRILGSSLIGFRCDERDPTRALLIDPGLLWASYLGSSNQGGFPNDIAYGVATAASGEVVVVGEASWGDFPVTPGTYSSPHRKGIKAFASVFDPTGSSLVYSALLGGNLPASPTSIAHTLATAVDVGPQGEVVVVGWTSNPDFPVTPGAFDTVKEGPVTYPSRSGFVTKFDRSGTKLVYSTFLEGTGEGDEVLCVRVDDNGAAMLGGKAGSYDFPVTPSAFDTGHGPSIPGFVCRLDPTGTALEWSTYLGTIAAVTSLRLGGDENVYTAGWAGPGFPASPGAFDTTFNGGDTLKDAFVAKLSSDGQSLVWGTYLGGQGDDTDPHVAVHDNGDVIMAGRTMSLDFPTSAGAFQTQHTPSQINNTDTFVARFSKDGSSLVYSTFVASAGPDFPAGIAVDAAGIVTWGGTCAGCPITLGAHDPIQQLREGVVARLSVDGKRLFYSSYLGGSGHEEVLAASVDDLGAVSAVGFTTGGFPVTPGAFSTTYFGGQFDAFVARVELQPIGVLPFGESTPNCHGPFLIGVTEQPKVGSSTFSLYASGAPENGLGLLALSAIGNPWGRELFGVTLWLGTSGAVSILPVKAKDFAYAEVVVPIPQATQGLDVFAQFLFQNTAACGGAGSYSATNALRLTIQ